MAVEGHLCPTFFGEDAHVGHRVFTEGVLVLSAVEVAVDLCLVAVVGQDLDVLTQLGLRLGCPAQEVLEVELNEAVRGVGFEETAAVLRGERDGPHQFSVLR